jgi:hypothetical protein
MPANVGLWARSRTACSARERPHSGAKPIFNRSGYSRPMGADEAGKVTMPYEQRRAVAAAAGRHVS